MTGLARLRMTGQALDTRLFFGLYRFRGTWGLESAMAWMSRSADGPFYLVVALALLVLRVPQAPAFVAAALCGFALELPAYKILKRLFRRERPFDVLPGVRQGIRPPDHYSFPSGHAAGAFLMVHIAVGHVPELAPILYAWASAVACSRVYFGVHYPADVIAGAFLGSGAGWAGLELMS